MKVTYWKISGRVRCPFQFNKEICYPGCNCTSKSCWEEMTKEVNGQELKEMINNCSWISKVE